MARRKASGPETAARGVAGGARRVALKVELEHVRPKVWRRVLVPESTTLARLHTILQITMGWHDSHLHEFVIDDEHYGSPDLGEFGDRVASARRVRIADLLRRGVKKFVYTYDFGDGWEHIVTLERATARLPGQPAVECVGGANACPLEDVGGPWGYAELVAILADPAHPEYEERFEWTDGPIDPTAFDLATVNRALATLRP
jgi:hypothetical protein